jgi:hypothetical protein
MRIECTDLLLKYRDLTRLTWNSAFWPNADLRDGDIFTVGDYVCAFKEAVARLYEGMVLLPLGLGHDCRVQDLNYPGKAVPLSIQVTSASIEWLIDEDLPGDPNRRWSRSDLSLQEGAYDFEFRNFFDWEQLGHRDFLFVEVLIRRMDAKPDAVGHHALVPAVECSAWVPARTNPPGVVVSTD